MRILMVPNECSTTSRRVRIASGLRSSRSWAASRTCSFSQRLIRRGVADVHFR
jgi:hypothetical protein